MTVRRVKDETVAEYLPQLRALLPKGVVVSSAFKNKREDILDLLYTIWSSGYEDGDADGYDRGYDEARESFTDTNRSIGGYKGGYEDSQE